MIHYHGTPLTPRGELQKLAGKCFCVSFAAPGDAGWCLANGQSVMWDNGAFSAFTRGHVPNWTAYYDWLESRLSPVHWAVVPDVIDGTGEQQDVLLDQWPHARHLSCPVWHMALPIERLLALADGWPRIAFGSSGQYWQVGSDAWCRRADEAWNALERHGSKPWVHMMRGLAICGDRWPFTSADSVNVARNYASSSVDPERMARRIDAVQSPIQWSPRLKQMELLPLCAS